MNRLLLSIAALSTLLSPSSASADTKVDAKPAQDEYRHRAVGVFANPIAMATGLFGGEVDVAVARTLSINATGNGYSKRDESGKWSGFGGDLGVQWFPIAQTFHGLYVYPRVAYFSMKYAQDGGPTIAASAIGAGGTIGWQWGFDFGLAVRLGAGAIYYRASAADNGNVASLSLQGVAPAIDASLGWLF